ncbi:calcium-binding protein [Pseudomonas jilinensis]|nr:calcium-binding protein [Pseudomonas jilinensis]
MDIERIIKKLGVTAALNAILGQKVFGVGALFHSEKIGGYANPNYIDGYTFNVADGVWYKSPPAPAYGQYGWFYPAPADVNSELSRLREVRIQHNILEGLSPLAPYMYTVSPDVNGYFRGAFNTVSPIVLDLDGDGLETYGANWDSLFDHNGDGIRHGSGWVRPDDGFLVRDVNGNGVIDDGAELFGENTLLADGTRAKDGFEALQAVDSNGDGKLDANDDVWSDLRIWRDFNGDGISQEDELFTLEEIGIKSISTQSDGVRKDLGNNNHVDGFGSFEWDEERGGGQGVMGDVYFEENKFYRQFADRLEIPEELWGLPDMAGSGAVRDLREAATLSSELVDSIKDYAGASTRSEQYALVGGVIQSWAGTADFRTFDQRVSDMNTDTISFKFSYSWEIPDTGLVGSGGSGGSTVVAPDGGSGPTAAQLEKKELLEMIRVLEVFNGQEFFKFSSATTTTSSTVSFSFLAGSQGRRGSAALASGREIYVTEEHFHFGPQQERNIRAAYASLMDSVYNGLLLQTRLSDYLNEVGLNISVEGGIALDFGSAYALLADRYVDDPVNAIVDLVELNTRVLSMPGFGKTDPGLVAEWIRELDEAQLAALRSEIGVVIGGDSGETLTGSSSVDVIIGGAGRDSLNGGDGADYLLGGDERDILRGGAGNDFLYGGAGNDQLYGDAGDDILDGGAGDDRLYGGAGNDTYLFGRGDGHDTIYNDDVADRNNPDSHDRLLFKEGVALEDVSYVRSGNNLVLRIEGTSDSVTVNNWFATSVGSHKLQSIEFADGRSLDLAQVEIDVRTIHGTDGNNTLQGAETDDVLYGYAGNDTLRGGGGNDILYGGDGNDTLYGDAGDDILVGGAGDDYLVGGAGSDLYLFGTGSGRDTIYNHDTDASSIDTARFEDVAVEDLWFSRSGNHLQINVAGTTDQVTVSNWYLGSAYQLDRIEAGSSVLLDSQVDQLVAAMSAYAVPSGAGSILSQQVKDELQTVLADTWQPNT